MSNHLSIVTQAINRVIFVNVVIKMPKKRMSRKLEACDKID